METMTITEPVKVTTALTDRNRLFISCSYKSADLLYMFCIHRNGAFYERSFAQPEAEYVYWLAEQGEYQIRVVLIDHNDNKLAFWSEPIHFPGLETYDQVQNEKESVFASVKYVLKELYLHKGRAWRVAVYDHRIRNKDSYLGKLWTLLNPLIQIGTFWLVFGQGFRQGQPIHGLPYLLWMLTGLLPWFFVNAGIVGGASSVYAKAGTVLRLRYPIATIPVSNILTAFIDFAMTLGILLIVMLSYGYYPTWYWLNILYYIAYSIVFLSLLAMITSTLTMIARDFQKLINSLMRLLFYMTPILWSIESMPVYLQKILKINPVLYIVDGFRDSLLYEVHFTQHWGKIAFFWGLNFILLLLGCSMQRKFKSQFIDLL